jgi:hypothetical protein
LALVLLVAAPVFAASCGSDDGSETTSGRSSAAAVGSGQEESEARTPGQTGDEDDSDARRQLRLATRLRDQALKSAETDADAETAGSTAGVERGSGAWADDPEPSGSARPGKNPSKPAQTPSVEGTDTEQESIHTLARTYCSDKQAIDHLPERQRTRENLLQLARRFAPPGTEQAAEAGCLEGLQSIGY